MTRLFSADLQPITVTLSPERRLTALRWHEKEHEIEETVQVWEVDTDWWEATGRVWRWYYAVITEQGLLAVVFLDRATGKWWLERVYD